MSAFVRPRLINGPFADATLYLDFTFRKRALIFDLGDILSLSSREVLRISHVFVSHMHMDHFVGFDSLLRRSLHRNAELTIVGPPGLADAVHAKLRAYTWNLLDETSPDLSILACDWTTAGFNHASLYRARSAFRRCETEPPPVPAGVVLAEPEFRVEAAMLDHGVPSLAFALQERLRVNVHKARLDELGLPVGPWLTDAKQAIRQGRAKTACFTPAGGRIVTAEELLRTGVLVTGRGQRIVYATDLAGEAANFRTLVELAAGADQLFIEAAFLEQDHQLAALRKHLTALQAGRIASEAGVINAVPMHFSPRYADCESDLRAEFARGRMVRVD